MERAGRHTRWQAAPDWSSGECLTLVNEINAVEGEWGKSLSSFQKWQLVVENCSALDISRSLNQCKRKWDSLRSEYEKIKAWERSFWSFDIEKRKRLGLPEEFDEELFRAMSKYYNQKGDDIAAQDTDPDSDPEARARTKRIFLHTGPKKQRKKRVRFNTNIAERVHPWIHLFGGMMKPEPSGFNVVGRDAGQMMNQIPRLQVSPANEAQEHESGSTPQKVKPMPGKDLQKMMTAKLVEKAQLINVILQGIHADDEVDYTLADLKNSEAMEIDSVRSQGDKIINCLGDIVNTLNQFCNAIQESHDQSLS